MMRLMAAILLATSTVASADHVQNRVLDGKALLYSTPCIEQSTGRNGYCEIYEGDYVAFWARDGQTILWIKDSDGNIVYTDGEVGA